MARNSGFTITVDKAVGLKISKLRIAHGMSRQQLGEKVGVTHQQLAKYETGTNRIAAGRLLSIARAFNKPISYFFEDYDIEPELPTQHRRMCIEVSRNFLKIKNPMHQNAINLLVQTLSRN